MKFDWDLAVYRQRRALLRVVALLVAMVPDLTVETVARGVRVAVYAILRPAEAATRRVIEVLASRLTVEPRGRSGAPMPVIERVSSGRTPCFALFDRRKRVGPPEARKSAPGAGPRVLVIGVDVYRRSPSARPPSADDIVDATAMCRRLRAVIGALDDLPRQARRLARILASGTSKWLSASRRGRPPGHREGGKRRIDEILK